MSRSFLRETRAEISEKVRESAASVLPVVVIVALLCLSVSPLGTDLMLCFIIGTLMIIAGMGLFSLGADRSMTPIGNYVGAALTKTKICRSSSRSALLSALR